MSKYQYAVIRCPLSTNTEWILAIYDNHSDAASAVEYHREHPGYGDDEADYYVAEIYAQDEWVVNDRLDSKMVKQRTYN